VDQLLQARKIPARSVPCSVGLTAHPCTHQCRSGLNLLFASTLKKMGLNISKMLTPSKAPFYSIVPRNAATPIGSVTLPVTFWTKENYRTVYIKFEVVDFESSYHAIIGRPVVEFMVVPHYVYLLLRMLGKAGVLTFRGDLKKSYDCDQEAIEYSLTNRTFS
jgi:hypothetical protein